MIFGDRFSTILDLNSHQSKKSHYNYAHAFTFIEYVLMVVDISPKKIELNSAGIRKDTEFTPTEIFSHFADSNFDHTLFGIILV